MNREFTWRDDDWNDDVHVRNPYSRITCLILYLYSLELGDPPLYAEVNRVCRDFDRSQLENLGPYCKTLSLVTQSAEKNRLLHDKRETGKIMQEAGKAGRWNMSGSFVLFRGAQMKKDWYAPWQHSIYTKPVTKEDNPPKEDDIGMPMWVHMPGNASCSHDLSVALSFATREVKPDHDPILFIISCQNYFTVSGTNMNHEAYTSYPSEEELLMREGTKIYVLGVESDVEINNPHPSFAPFNGLKLTIIHLFEQR